MRFFLAFVLFSAIEAGAQAPAGSIERGRKVFQEKWCHSCHGTVGQGGERGAGPRIAPNPFPYEAFVMQTRRPRANMPRYPVEVLGDQEMADIYAYVSSIKPGLAAKDLPLLRE
ncbi:MAG TPA: cytochrome c [Burkholderiales bacterium]|nr:cytochrome c [Burkholderiales bacterium]